MPRCAARVWQRLRDASVQPLTLWWLRQVVREQPVLLPGDVSASDLPGAKDSPDKDHNQDNHLAAKQEDRLEHEQNTPKIHDQSALIRASCRVLHERTNRIRDRFRDR